LICWRLPRRSSPLLRLPPAIATPTPTPALADTSAGASAPAAATSPAPAASEGIGMADGEQTGTRVVITDLKRGGGTLTLKFTIYNDSSTDIATGYRFKADGYAGFRNFSAIHLLDGISRKEYFVVEDSENHCACSDGVDDIKPKTQQSLWAKFPEPPDNVKRLQ
jgi:hypothetical protein